VAILKTLTAVAALATALVVSSSANAAVLISLGTSLNGGAITTQASGFVNPGDSVTYAPAGGLTIGNYLLSSIAGTYDFAPGLLSGNTIAMKKTSGSNKLDIYVTLSNVDPSQLGLDTLFSSYSASLGPAGSTVSTFYDAANGIFNHAAGNLLATATFSGNTSGGPVTSFVPTPGGLFSLTEQFHINVPGRFNSGIDLATADVPEPATWGLMIMGFGGIGAVVRNRRRRAIAIA
jgi:hypothetical protein